MDVFDLYATISIKLDDFEKGLEKAKTKAESFAKNISGLSSSIDKAYSGVKDVLQPAVDGFKAVEGVGKKAESAIKKGLTGFAAVSTALGGGMVSAANAGMQFDATMSEVSAISGATGQEFDDLRAKALQMAASTKFGASEVAQAYTYMGMAGWKTEDMLSGIPGILNLASASGEDLATTSDIVTDALTAFNMTAADSGHFADVLAAASTNANTDVSMLGESFKYVAPVAGAMKYSVEDVSVALGLMANSSVKGSMAGTSLKTAMLNMASPTKAMKGVMDQYGISLTDTNGEMYSLGEVIEQLRSKLGGLDETTQAAAASTLFGKEAATGMLAIINASTADYEKLTSAIYDCNGAAEKMSDTMMDNLAGDITKMKSAFESLQIAISDSLTPTLREFAQFGQKAMAGLLEGFQGGGVTGFMSALSGIVTEGVTVLAAKAPEFASISVQFVTALADGILGAGPSILNSLYEVIQVLIVGANAWLSSNSTALANFGLDIIGRILGGFQRAGNVISRYIGDFVPAIAEAFLAYHYALFEVGLNILGAIGQGIVDNKDRIQFIASGTITDMVLALKENAPAIIEGGLALLEALVGAIEENLPLIIETGAVIIGKLIEGITTASPGVQAIIATAVLPHILNITKTIGDIGGAFSSIAGIFNNGFSLIGGIISKLSGLISGLFSLIMAHPVIAVIAAVIAAVTLLWTHCEEFRNLVKGAVDAIVGFVSGAVDMVVGFFEKIIDFVKNNWQGILLFIVNPFAGAFKLLYDNCEAFQEFIDGLMEKIKGIFKAGWEAVKGFFSSAWDAIKAVWGAAEEFFSGVWEGIQSVFSVVADVLGGFFSAAWDLISGVWEAAVDFFSSVWDGIRTTAETAAGLVGDALSAAWDAITSVWDGAVSFFGGIWDGIKGVFSDVWDHFLDIGGNIVNGIKDGIARAWDAFIGWLDGKVGGIVNGVKSMLGIHSPSTVFAGIGENMALGLAEGWDDQYTSIKRQIENGMNFGTATVGLTANGTHNPSETVRNGDLSGFGGGGNVTVNIYNPEKRDAVTEAREWKKTAQRMAMGYV